MAQKLRNIAVLVTAIDANAQIYMLQGIDKFRKMYNCNVAIFTWFTSSYEKEKHNLGEINILNLPDFNLFDGIIVVANTVHIQKNRIFVSDMLKSVKCPIVCVGAQLDDYPCVGTDTYSAMRKLVEHFIFEHNMRSFHFVKGIEGNIDAEERYRAFVDVLKENHIPLEEERITQGDFYIMGAELAAKQILESELPFPEAIICANDVMATTLCGILKRKGYSIPEDVAIGGYDGSDEGQLCTPCLTTVLNNSEEQGFKACEVLWDLMDGKEVPNEVKVVDKFILGESCGCKKESLHITDIGNVAFQRNTMHYIIQQKQDIMENASYENWLHALKTFISNANPTEFYYCVSDDFKDKFFEQNAVEQEGMGLDELLKYSETIKVMLAYKKGRFIEKADYPSKYAFDEMFNETEEGKLYIFSPIHYLEQNFGFFVFANSYFPINNQLYVGWLISMGHTIETIRKQKLLQMAMSKLDDMYIRDSLTNAYNRFGMERTVQKINEITEKEGKLFFLSFIDLDGLKNINDCYGHDSGDYIIKSAADILSFFGRNYYVVRYGGDEFIVMGIVSDPMEVEIYWQTVEVKIKSFNAQYITDCMLSLSYGSHIQPLTEEIDILECIKSADQKMYLKKNQKKELKKTEG